MTAGRSCGWCGGSLEGLRSLAIFCSTACRQRHWRFARQVSTAERAAEPLRLAYADPPYPGLAARYYEDHPDYAGEVDHRDLICRLCSYDGWALSTSARALPGILREVPEEALEGVLVASWHRGPRKVPSVLPWVSWEPVIFKPARGAPDHTPVPDSLVFVARARTSDPNRVVGAKPAAFLDWVFRLLGARRGDTLDDLFPGSGGVTRAWDLFCDPSR